MQSTLDSVVGGVPQPVRWRGMSTKRPAVLVGTVLAVATAIVHFVVSAMADPGGFGPVAVVGVETGLIALLWVIWERAPWTTQS
jgi:hypothetical protein